MCGSADFLSVLSGTSVFYDAGVLTFCQYFPVRWPLVILCLFFELVCYISVTSLPVCVLSFILFFCVLFLSNIIAHLGTM